MNKKQENTEILEVNKNIPTLLTQVDALLNKTYLPMLSQLDIISLDNEEISFTKINSNIRFFELTRIVLNKNENMRDKLVTVFNAVGTSDSSFIYIINGKGEEVSIYLGVKGNQSNFFDEDNKDKNEDNKDKIDSYTKTYKAQKILESGIKGNFQGSKIEIQKENQVENSIYVNIFKSDSYVVSVSDVAGIRNDKESKENQFVQGIEKLVNSMHGQEYSLVVIADPVSLGEINEQRRTLENLYSALVPYSESSLTVNKSQSESVGESIAKGTSYTISESLSKSNTKSNGKSFNPLALLTVAGAVAGACAPGVFGPLLGISAKAVGSIMLQTGMIGSQVGGIFGINSGNTKGDSEQKGNSDGKSYTATESTNYTLGESESNQIKFENHTIKRILNKIDELLKRYDTCADIGMWRCATYCISQKQNIAQTLASSYHSLIRGKNSGIENGCINVWDHDKSKEIIKSLKNMEHPYVGEGDNIGFTPAMLISSADLAIQAGLPNKSVPGVPVIECAEFGTTIQSYDVINNEQGTINVGHFYHMNQEDKNRNVELGIKNFCSHTFITGSTGCGKSTTVYKILRELNKKGCKFLVIEPAKGEYKEEFHDIAKVYGTNEKYTEILRINPFSFPESVSVSEHIESIVEIFNVCWPMYAAMPQVLKDSIIKSYEDLGWNIDSSENEYSDNPYEEKYFPCFEDVVRNIKDIINSSEYSNDTKSDYKGALETRLKSMTTGSNGKTFTCDELSVEELFENNVIIDLSRLRSSETKALVMGILVLKLTEYRMNPNSEQNSDLKHVTVLEEAHHLLKRTSTEQSNESSNLIGKSVELISNSIAEMRTYGEGFIIADQSPGVLDMSVIRNTNTKMIMRLPDYQDRQLVGKSASLNDDQINELAKLPTGVVAVYQNEWIQPILCKIEKYTDSSGEKFKYSPNLDKDSEDKSASFEDRIDLCEKIFNNDWDEIDDLDGVDKYIKIKIKMFIEKYKKGFVTNNQETLEKGELYYLLLSECRKKLEEYTDENSDLTTIDETLKKHVGFDSFTNEGRGDRIFSDLINYYSRVKLHKGRTFFDGDYIED